MFRLVERVPCRTALQRALQEQSCRGYNRRSQALPAHVREAGFGKVIFILSPFIAVGGAVTYAKHDADFRKTLEKTVPGASYVIKVALQEENPLASVTKQIDNVTKSVEGVTSTVTGFFKSSEKEKPKVEETKPRTNTTSTTAPTTQQTTATPPSKKPDTVKESKPAAPVQIAKPTEPLPKDVLDLEKTVELSAALAVKEYNKAINLLKSFNEDVRQVVEKAVENADTSAWRTLSNKTSARDTAVSIAEKLAREALEKIERCEVALSKAANPQNHEQVLAIRKKVKTCVDHINQVKDELYKSKDLANLSEKYWRNVEKSRNYFIDEIESIFPGLNLADKKLTLSPEDLDLLIMHAFTHVLAYQKELQRLQTDGELRLKRAIDAFRGDSDTEASKAQLDYLLEAERRKLAIENQKRIFQIRAEAEKQLRQQLKQQAEAHVDHLNDAIAVRESEIKRNYSRELEQKLEKEKANYKLQVAEMLGKMRGMEEALQARADSERAAHQAQALWAACQALWSTVRTGEPGVHWREKLRPLRSEIKAVVRAAEGDELVAVVLQNLPVEAQERGVFPEDALRERFLSVERTARKVAMVRGDDSSIPMYLLSYLQSIFILRPDNPISEDELVNKEFDFSKLDAYEILDRARYYVDRGDLLHALKYMNLLQGASRKIASDWLKEARLLLETQQAANTLMSHAAASGLLYL